MSDTLSAGSVSIGVSPNTTGFGAKLHSAVLGESANFGGVGAKIGGLFALGIVGGLAVAGAASLKMASDFQTSTTQLITGAGESEKNIGMVRDGILAMAGAVGTMPEELSKGMYLIESAGYHGAAGLSVLKSAAMGAKVGGAEMATVANALTTAMTDYNIPADRANAVTSALVATTAAGKMHMQDLANSLGMVMPKAAALGVSFADVNGALATMTSSGMSARRASMNLSNTIMALGAPSKGAADALKGIGLSAQRVKDDLSKKGLAGTMAEITDAVGKHFPAGSVEAVTAFKKIMGGTVGYGTALALTGTHQAAFAANVKSIGSALNGQTKDVQGFALVQKDLAFQVDAAKAKMVAWGIQLGNVLLPIATKMMEYISTTAIPALQAFAAGFAERIMPAIKRVGDFITGTVVPGFMSLVKWLKENQAWLMPIAVGVGAMVAAFQIYQGVMATVRLATAAYAVVQGVLNVVMAANPIGIVILAIVGLAAGLIYAYKTSETFRDVVNTVFHAIQVVIGKVVSVVIEIFRSMLKSWTTVIGGLLSAAATIAEKLHLPFADSMRKASDAFNGMAKAADDKLKSVADSASHWGEQTGANFTAGIGGSLRSAGDMAKLMGARVASGFASGIAGGTQLAVMAASSMAGQAQAAMASNLAPPTHRASGGPVMAGQSYIVGENRPELFVPNQNGTIIPQVSGGHGGSGDAIFNTSFVIDGKVLFQAMRRASIDEARRNGTSGLKL